MLAQKSFLNDLHPGKTILLFYTIAILLTDFSGDGEAVAMTLVLTEQ